jgi:hypothetical protein
MPKYPNPAFEKVNSGNKTGLFIPHFSNRLITASILLMLALATPLPSGVSPAIP